MLKKVLYSAVFLAICGSPIQTFGAYPEHSIQTSTYGFFDFLSSKPMTSELHKEIGILKLEIEKLKDQQREIIAIINSAKSDMISIHNEQKRRMDNSNELEGILVKYGNTPNHISVLNHAIEAGDVNAVNLLLANGADVNSGKGQAISTAARYNQIEIAQILLEIGADVNCTPNESNNYPIYYAAQFGSIELVHLFIEHGAFLDRIRPIKGNPLDDTITPLHIAAKHGNYEAVVALVNGGAKIDGHSRQNNGQSQTPLDEAAFSLKYKDNQKNLDLVKFLVESGATRRCRNYNTEYVNGYKTLTCPVISGYLKGVGK